MLDIGLTIYRTRAEQQAEASGGGGGEAKGVERTAKAVGGDALVRKAVAGDEAKRGGAGGQAPAESVAGAWCRGPPPERETVGGEKATGSEVDKFWDGIFYPVHPHSSAMKSEVHYDLKILSSVFTNQIMLSRYKYC